MRRERAEVEAEPIRLLQFVRSFYLGGTEGQVVELLRALPKRYQIKVALEEDAGPLLESVWAMGHLPKQFSLKGTVIQANTGAQIGRLALWLKKERIQLVHAHDFYTTLLAVPASRIAGCKVVVGRLDLAHWLSPVQKRCLAWCTRLADRVIANAEPIRTMVVDEEHVPKERVDVIHNGIDVARFDRRAREPLASPLPEVGEAPVIVHVANMTHPVKRQEDLLLALSLLKRGGSPAHVFFVGDGHRRPELEKMAADLEVSDRAHFLGHRTDVPAIYARVQVGVLCSSAEGLSNAVIEGMTASLPMVVTRVGGNPELVEDGVRGRVVPPFRPASLAKALEEILASAEHRHALGKAARAFVERELTLGRMVERHDQLYRELLRPKPSLVTRWAHA